MSLGAGAGIGAGGFVGIVVSVVGGLVLATVATIGVVNLGHNQSTEHNADSNSPAIIYGSR